MDVRIKYTPDTTVEIIEIFLKLSYSFKKGGKKYKNPKVEKAAMLLAPTKKVSFAPYPSIGNTLLKSRLRHREPAINSIPINTAGKINTFILAIDLSPSLLMNTIGIKKNKSRKAMGVVPKIY